jgi:hypothetical protein
MSETSKERNLLRCVSPTLVLTLVIVFTAATLTLSLSADGGLATQQIYLVASLYLPGSFVTPQSVHADSERIYLGSYQGHLFILERDRQSGFPLIQTISIGAPLTAVRGDKDKIYVASRNGNLYVFNKTWPVQLSRTISLSTYGLSSLEVVGKEVYVAKGQGALTATDSFLFLSGLNPGDFAVEVGTMRSYGESPFVSGATIVFDRQTQRILGTMPNPAQNFFNIHAGEEFLFLTSPGCCSTGIYVYDAVNLSAIQVLSRPTNTVASVKRRGIPLAVGASEGGAVDLYAFDKAGYQFIDSVDLPAATGFTGPEDIEIRALWIDGIDNLVFAASSWGNDRSRAAIRPSLLVLEIRKPPRK